MVDRNEMGPVAFEMKAKLYGTLLTIHLPPGVAATGDSEAPRTHCGSSTQEAKVAERIGKDQRDRRRPSARLAKPSAPRSR